MRLDQYHLDLGKTKRKATYQIVLKSQCPWNCSFNISNRKPGHSDNLVRDETELYHVTKRWVRTKN